MISKNLRPIDWQETKNFLRGGVRLGGTIHSYETAASTQTPAKDAARQGAAQGTVFVTECQNSGRGRRDREWTSAPGLDLTFSVILRPNIGAVHAQLLNLAAAIAVGDALENIFAEISVGQANENCTRPFDSKKNPIGIKWPNDVMANGKKICGIICEISGTSSTSSASGAEGRIDYAVLGIGVNVNGAACDMPVLDSPDRPRATSVFIETGRKTALPQLLGKILSNLDELAGMVESEGGRVALIEVYRKKSCTLGEYVRVVTDEGETQGVASNITDEGALSIKDGEGRVLIFHAADVVHAYVE